MTELITLEYTILNVDISVQMDHMAAKIKLLKVMSVTIEDFVSVAILFALIEVTGIHPATTAMKTLAEDDIKGEAIAARLAEEVEESEGGKSIGSETNLTAVQQNIFDICAKEGHSTATCFLAIKLRTAMNRSLKDQRSQKAKGGK